MRTRQSYPKKASTTCVCGAVIPTVRVGDGKPWRGGFNYWYTFAEPHECQERREAQAEMDRLRSKLG